MIILFFRQIPKKELNIIMSDTRLEIKEFDEVVASTSSHIKPILVESPEAELQAFFYKKGAEGFGLSPNGKRVVRLTKNEGEHHIKVRDKSGYVYTEDSPVKSPVKKSLAHQEIKLSLRLVNLKNRTDEDYKYYKLKEEISISHYDAARIKIKECIAQFKLCYSLSPDKAAFINKYNQKIKEGCFYNPFRLQQIYASENFDRDEYQKACDTVDYHDFIKISDVEIQTQYGLKRPREEAIALFMPRNVKMRLLQDKCQNDFVESVAKKRLKF